MVRRMAYVPGFQYDIFISYRQVDNEFGWVTKLDETLRSMLHRHARPSKDETPWKYEIFRDKREIGGNQPLPEVIHDAATSSAALVIVMSEDYLATDSEWCARELEAFLGTADADRRIFIVRKSDVAEREWPRQLRKFVGYQFWETDADTGMVSPMSFDFSASGRVPPICQKLGTELWSTLDKLRESRQHAPAPSAPSTDATPAPESGSVVFLAEVTEPLQDERKNFITFLEQEGIRVVPEKNRQYRLQPERAKNELPALLKQATLVVQLLDTIPIPAVKGFEKDGFEPWLHERAKACGKTPGETLLRWRQSEIAQQDIEDCAHGDLLFQSDVIAEDLERFKQMVVDRVRELAQCKFIEEDDSGAKVIVPTRDKVTHRQVTDKLVDKIDAEGPELAHLTIRAAQVFDGVELKIVAQELARRNSPTKAMIVVHADGDEQWVQDRMNECREYQLSKRPNMPPCAVFVKPPDENQHPKWLPGRFRLIRHDDSPALDEFLKEIGREASR